MRLDELPENLRFPGMAEIAQGNVSELARIHAALTGTPFEKGDKKILEYYGLEMAIKCGQLEVVKWLWENAKSFRADTWRFRYGVFWAIDYGQLEILNWILQKEGENPNISVFSDAQMDFWQRALKKGDVRIMDSLKSAYLIQNLVMSDLEVDPYFSLIENDQLQLLKELGFQKLKVATGRYCLISRAARSQSLKTLQWLFEWPHWRNIFFDTSNFQKTSLEYIYEKLSLRYHFILDHIFKKFLDDGYHKKEIMKYFSHFKGDIYFGLENNLRKLTGKDELPPPNSDALLSEAVLENDFFKLVRYLRRLGVSAAQAKVGEISLLDYAKQKESSLDFISGILELMEQAVEDPVVTYSSQDEKAQAMGVEQTAKAAIASGELNRIKPLMKRNDLKEWMKKNGLKEAIRHGQLVVWRWLYAELNVYMGAQERAVIAVWANQLEVLKAILFDTVTADGDEEVIRTQAIQVAVKNDCARIFKWLRGSEKTIFFLEMLLEKNAFEITRLQLLDRSYDQFRRHENDELLVTEHTSVRIVELLLSYRENNPQVSIKIDGDTLIPFLLSHRSYQYAYKICMELRQKSDDESDANYYLVEMIRQGHIAIDAQGKMRQKNEDDQLLSKQECMNRAVQMCRFLGKSSIQKDSWRWGVKKTIDFWLSHETDFSAVPEDPQKRLLWSREGCLAYINYYAGNEKPQEEGIWGFCYQQVNQMPEPTETFNLSLSSPSF